MPSIGIAGISFGCIFGGALLGMLFRKVLPPSHVQDESKDIIKLGAGFVATMAALVLGLLVSSAKSSYDAMNDGFKQSGAKLLLLDRALKQFGPETIPLRDQLRRQASRVVELVWPTDGKAKENAATIEKSQDMEMLQVLIRLLPARNDQQRAVQTQALAISSEIMQSRWLMIEHTQNSLPTIFFMIVVFWLTILHVSFGLLAPHNVTVWIVLLLSSLSVSAALFLISELNNPLDGVIHIAKGPMEKVLEHLGK